MVLIVVYNMRVQDLEFEERIEKIEKALTDAIVAIRELRLTGKDIDFNFPMDPTVESEDIPVTIEIKEFEEKPERTQGVRQRVSDAVTKTFRKPVEEWRGLPFVEAFIPPFNSRRDCYSSA